MPPGLHSRVERWNTCVFQVWLALPCSSWVWMSRGSTRRSRLRVKGPKYLKKVRDANRLARRACFLCLVYIHRILHVYLKLSSLCVEGLLGCRMELAFKKGLTYTIEQPRSSLLPLYKPLEVGVGHFALRVSGNHSSS